MNVLLSTRVIVFFEALRRAYGHTEVLPLGRLWALYDEGGWGLGSSPYVCEVEAVANAGEAAYMAAHPQEREYSWRGVTPSIVYGGLEHTTCSGATTIVATGGAGREEVQIKRRRPLVEHHLAPVWIAGAAGDLEGVIDALRRAISRDYWGSDAPEAAELEELLEVVRSVGLPPIAIKELTHRDVQEEAQPALVRLAEFLGKEVEELTLTDIMPVYTEEERIRFGM